MITVKFRNKMLLYNQKKNWLKSCIVSLSSTVGESQVRSLWDSWWTMLTSEGKRENSENVQEKYSLLLRTSLFNQVYSFLPPISLFFFLSLFLPSFIYFFLSFFLCYQLDFPTNDLLQCKYFKSLFPTVSTEEKIADFLLLSHLMWGIYSFHNRERLTANSFLGSLYMHIRYR